MFEGNNIKSVFMQMVFCTIRQLQISQHLNKNIVPV